MIIILYGWISSHHVSKLPEFSWYKASKIRQLIEHSTVQYWQQVEPGTHKCGKDPFDVCLNIGYPGYPKKSIRSLSSFKKDLKMFRQSPTSRPKSLVVHEPKIIFPQQKSLWILFFFNPYYHSSFGLFFVGEVNLKVSFSKQMGGTKIGRDLLKASYSYKWGDKNR